MRLILISIIMLMLTLMFNYIAINACFNTIDKYSVEIVLNK